MPEPQQLAPCEAGSCWEAPEIAVLCGLAAFDEDFSTGLYNVHEYPLVAPQDVALELSLERTAGDWSPALLVADHDGVVYHDGEISGSDGSLEVELVSTGRESDVAAAQVMARQQDRSLYVYATAWGVVDSGFVDFLPTDATYELGLFADCEVPSPGELLSPPNFDPDDVEDGYYLLPYSQPPGLYTRKPDDCSRGTQLLIDVLYTVAWHWHQRDPSRPPIAILDLNEGECSGVDHETHDDGTHADLVAGCATDVYCADKDPVVELAKLVVDTGQACGIINDNDADVRAEVNEYFESQFSYQPWHGTFMRSIGGHTGHFHIRVKKPDGTCN